MAFFPLYMLVIAVISTLCNSAKDLICPSYPPTAPLDPTVFTNVLNEVDEYIKDTIIRENNITGFITSIVYDQQLLFSKGYGLRKYMEPNSGPPRTDDLVMVASNTKLFAALLAYYLRDNDYNVSFNDPITKYLPSFSIKSIYDSNQSLTLAQLLSHTAGLQDSAPSGTNEAEILQALSKKYLVYPPYSQFHYSNLGFSLLGRSTEKVLCAETGGCWEQYTKKIILDGLNFSEYSGFNYSNYVKDNHCAFGWYPGSSGQPMQGPIASHGWQNPAGGMLASVTDMAKFMMFMFRDNITTSQHPYQILDGVTVTEMLNGKMLLNDGMESVGTPFEMHYHQFATLHDYNAGLSGVWYKGKQGEVRGYRSCTMMIPAYKLGVFSVALEDPSEISEGSVWTNNMLQIILPTLDNLLYEHYVDNVEYFLPPNYQLLVGRYGNSMSIEMETNSRKQQYLVMTRGATKYNFLLFKEDITDIYRTGNDLRESQSTCFWGGSNVNELLYFDFANGSNNHAVSCRIDEDIYLFQPT